MIDCNVSGVWPHRRHVTFEEYVSARLPALLRYAVMLTGDPHLAQDVVQDTMVRAHSQWRRITRADNPDAYVKRMVTNTFLGWRRTGWLRRATPVATVPDKVQEDFADAGAVRRDLWVRLGELPARQRAAVVLRYYEDLPDGEIAEMLGCAVGTVRSLISRALESLRRDVAMGPVAEGGRA